MSLEEGVSMLMRASAKTEVFLFLDALNESKDPTQMLDIVKRLVKESPSVRVMISSTQELNDPFITTEAAIIEMKQMRVRRDVQAYIEDRLKHDPRLSVLPNSLKSEIAFTLQRDNDGMYVTFLCSKSLQHGTHSLQVPMGTVSVRCTHAKEDSKRNSSST